VPLGDDSLELPISQFLLIAPDGAEIASGGEDDDMSKLCI